MPVRPEHAAHVLLHDRALRPEGVVFLGARRDDPTLEVIRRTGVPCVLHRDPAITGEDARKPPEVILAISASARTGREIVLPLAGGGA